MPSALAIALPLTLAGVLIASAVSKFRSPDDLAGWAEIGVPIALRKEWLRRIHPLGELVLGVAIAVLGGILGLLGALVAVALMSVYTWLVARTVRQKDDASCACFGARTRVTRVTVIRNAWLTAVAVATAAVSWTTPLVGGPLAAGLPHFGWLIGLLVVAVTTTLILWQERALGAGPTLPGTTVTGSGDELDYVRTRTPAVPITLANGSVENLRTMAAHRPILLLSVSATCGPCAPVIEKLGLWRELLPEVDIRILLATAPEDSSLIETNEPQSLHDPQGYARDSLDARSTPTVVLLGIDGMLAGGPVTGLDDVEVFVGDVYESLRGERPPLAATVLNPADAANSP